MSRQFQVEAEYKPAGDQPEAIRGLVEGLESGLAHQTLLGVTGSGKTFATVSSVPSATPLHYQAPARPS